MVGRSAKASCPFASIMVPSPVSRSYISIASPASVSTVPANTNPFPSLSASPVNLVLVRPGRASNPQESVYLAIRIHPDPVLLSVPENWKTGSVLTCRVGEAGNLPRCSRKPTDLGFRSGNRHRIPQQADCFFISFPAASQLQQATSNKPNHPSQIQI